MSSILGSGRSPGVGSGNPLQYPCLEDPMNRGAWWTVVRRVTKSRTQLRQLSMYANRGLYFILGLLSYSPRFKGK